MDPMAQSVPDTFAMPIRGVKRKATHDRRVNGKKIRRVESSGMIQKIHNCQISANRFPGSDVSRYASFEESSDPEEDTTTHSSTQTPSTPLSSKPSPRWPSDLKNHACTYDGCEKIFNRPAKLAQHIRSHTNDRPFGCPYPLCTKDFLRDSHLKHHIKSAHSDVRDYVCHWENCGKNFITSTRLKRHYAAHEGRQKFMCTECAQSFRKHGTLQAHMTTVHEGKKRFICARQANEGRECGEGFDTVGKLKTHEGRVHGGKRFWCSICNPQGQLDTPGPDQELTFSTYAALQEHIKSEHPPTCEECGLQCSTQGTLKSHVEIQHGVLGVDERRTHVCPTPGCGRGFTKRGNLNMHQRLVHENKSFVCGGIDLSTFKNIGDWTGHNSCGQALSTKANLVEHIRTVHMGLDHSRKAKTTSKANSSSHGSLSAKKEVSTLTWLTGSGYGEGTGRDIPCFSPDCEFRFLRDYDLEIHLETSHGLPYHTVQDIMQERKSLTSLPTFEGSPVCAIAEDMEAERALGAQFDAEFGFGAVDKALEDRDEQGGEFWLGGHSPGVTNADDDWLHDEIEMDRLIAGDYGRENQEDGESQDIAMLDPALR